MKPSLIFAYILFAILAIWSVISGNMEFVIYAVTVLVVVLLLHWGDRKNDFRPWTIWMFNAWLLMHIIGGLLIVNGHAMYSQMLIPIIGEPYNIFKYDQFVHIYCYFAMTPLLWQVLVNHMHEGSSIAVMKFFTILAAIGVGGLNEIVEFTATVLVPDVNVGGYINNAIDIVCNSLGALLALPLLKRLPPRKR